MQVYKVKLNKEHFIKKEYVVDGYIGSEVEPGKIQLYTRSEAIKKARVFGGKIEAHGKKYTISSAKILQLAKSELGDDIINELRGREVYQDHETDNNPIYYGDVFEAILGEDSEKPLSKRMSFTTCEDITVLDIMSSHYQYIMLL